MGTPHRGTDIALWGTLIGNILPVNLRRDLISALKWNSSVFQTIAEDFRMRADNLNIYSYYERHKLERYGVSMLIVQKESATLGFPGECMRPMERDHTSMCYFADAFDGDYQSIVEDLKLCLLQKSGNDVPSPRVDECLAWIGRKAGTVSDASAPQPLMGTCEWFFKHDRLSRWLSSGTQQGLLWVTGDSGSGKTLLSKFVADNLSEYVRSQLFPPIIGPVTVCYFSYDQIFDRETSVVKMLSTLLHQILFGHKELSEHALHEWEKPGQSLLENFETLWKVFTATLEDSRLGYTVIIIDAIDECKEATQRLYVAEFKRLLVPKGFDPKIRILFTSQRSTVLRSSFHDVPNIHLDDAPFSGYLSEDVNMVIRHELDEGPSYPPKDREFVERSLCEQAGRTYLWAKFVIQELHQMTRRSRKKIQATLDRIPKDLTIHYEQCLIEICHDEDSWQGAVKLLKIIYASFQPLDTEEISFAVAVSGNQCSVAEVEQDCAPDIELHIRKTLGFLVRIADRRVYLSHNSLRRYLEDLSPLAKDDQLAKFALTTDAAHLEMAKICTSYLSLQDFDNDFFQRTPYSVADSSQPLDFDPEYSGAEITFYSEGLNASGKDFRFFDYCAMYWTTHVALAAQSAAEDTGIVAAIIKICAKDSSILQNWLELYWSTRGPKKESHHGFDPMVVASCFGLDAVLHGLIDNGIVDVVKSGPRALYWAANEGKTKIVKILLSHDIPASFKSFLDWTPLMRAAAAGHTETVKTLLSMDQIEVNEKNWRGWSALSYAIGNGHVEISGLLLENPNIDVNNIDDKGCTPLLYATSNGNEAMLRLLLEDGRANFSYADRRDRTALSYAVEHGNVKIVKLLLDQSSDFIKLELENQRTRPPVLYAAEKGHLQILRLLWDAGMVDFGVRDKEGFNTVILASKNHHVNVLEYLSVQDRKGFKAVDRVGTPPLSFAFLGNSPRRLETIDFLLDSNLVDLEQRENTGRTALFRAAASNFVEGVQHMINKGAQVNIVDERGQTPLHNVVIEGQSPEIVSCLLKNGANLEMCNGEGLTPFELAKKLSGSQASQMARIKQVLAEERSKVARLEHERKKAQKSRAAFHKM